MSYLLETLAVAGGGACLVALSGPTTWRRWQHGALLSGAILAVLMSALSYFDDWRGQPPAAWLHEHDFYHYYIGAKYFPELGYMRLYLCTVAALQEGGRELGQTSGVSLVRRLDAPSETLSGVALERAAVACRARFGAARWHDFRADIAALGARLQGVDAWQGLLVDLGNNSPPTWNLTATPIANRVPLTPTVLAMWPLVDQALLFVLVPLVVWRTFGVMALLAYGLVYCASPLAFLGWIGGSFQRADWYVALVCGVCALTSRRPALAGALFAYATACRVFPALFLVAAPVCLWLQARRGEAWRCASAGAALLALVLVATLLMFGVDIWSEFATVMQLRISPYGANTIGLHKLAACWNVLDWPRFAGGQEALRDASQWLETLAGDAARRQGVTLTIGLALCSAVALVVRRRSAACATTWVALVLLYVLLTPFTYYYAVLALLPLAIAASAGRLRALLMAIVLLGVLALRVVSGPFAAERGHDIDFYAVSLLSSQALLVMFAAALAALAAADWRAARAAADSTRGAAFALVSAAVALLLAVYGYRPVPASVVDFHDLMSLGPLTGSAGVTVRERVATASWPAGHFFELRFADGAQALGATLGALPTSRYRATLVMTAAPGYGRAEVHLGAQAMIIDGRSSDRRAVPRWISLGEITLDAHSRLLVRALDGAGARIGLSGLVLEPVPSS